MRKHNRDWLAHCQEKLVSLLHMHNLKKERLAQCQAELVSLLRMRKLAGSPLSRVGESFTYA
jgi:hypothetical protein